jgi:LmbE family N-acetylglucosaminyl deacetylase
LLPVVAALWAAAPLLGVSELEPAQTGGVEAVDRALASLSLHARVLVVGAHPDDEDTSLLALVRKGIGGEAAYLSLSRGEGGQNLIGPELGVGLGLIRTGELAAARSLEGTRQFFTRAYDFGYTRSLEETLQRWPKESLLEDAVRVVRRFKPQIVVAVFPEDSRAGHGQHQASGVVARELMEAAGYPDRYPHLSAEGYPPWQPEAFFSSVWWEPERVTAKFSLDAVDPFSGKSVYQIAASSRSMHRSQDMGTLQRLGRIEGGVGWEAGAAGESEDELFGGIDTSLSAIAGYLDSGSIRDLVQVALEEIELDARQARELLSPVALERSVPVLADIVAGLSRLSNRLSEVEDSRLGIQVVRELIEEKRRFAVGGLIAAAGVSADVFSDRATVVPGGSIKATAVVWNSGSSEVRVSRMELEADDDWRLKGTRIPEAHPRISGLEQLEFDLEVDRESEPTIAYFLRTPRPGDMYDWTGVDPEVRTNPLQPAPVRVRFELEVDGVLVEIEREAVHRYLDQATGEVREPIRIVPTLEVEIDPALILWPIQSSVGRQLRVGLRSHSDQPLRGRLAITLEPKWFEIPGQEFALDPGSTGVVRVDLNLPEQIPPGRNRLSVVAELESGQKFGSSYSLIRYPHIRPQPLVRQAETVIQVLDLELPELSRIGYIRGASDRVPEVLSEVGLEIELLTAETLESGDFSRFDAIVVGSRAYEIDPALRNANSSLLAYVQQGGLMVVQYQQYQFVAGGFAPFPLEIERPHGRVTDENSPVELVDRSHRVLNRPNRLDSSDWQDWVQERGLYFASTWDPAYEPILVLWDPDQPPQRGSLLVAEVGNGTYVYTGLSFFRELPAGVPGALRLFSNLLALGGS